MTGRVTGRVPARRPQPERQRVVVVEIEAVGGRGDGIARLDGRPLFLPYTAAGDRVRARVEGRRGEALAGSVLELLRPGPDRVAPACRHFGSCGGCALQHLSPAAHDAWKHELVTTALDRQGLDPGVVAPLVPIAPGSRRRAAFAFLRRRDGVALGFNARASRHVLDLAECPVLDPALTALLAPLRALLAAVLPAGAGGDVVATIAGDGVDVLIDCDAVLDLERREALAAFAAAHDLTGLSWRRGGEIDPLARCRPASVTMGGVPVEPPPGGFLQASPAGERAIVELVLAAIGTATPVADLFAGCGTLSLPLARRGAVHAVEGEGAALDALKRAAGAAMLPVTTETRDLTRRPLLPEELRRFAAVVFDPPRAGAAEQAAMLAGAKLPLVVGVSCHPASFARDARLLVEGGFRLEAVTPVDQFAWSAHVELVGVFRRQ